MSRLELQDEVSGFTQLFKMFESLLGYRRKLGLADDQLAIDLCELYAIWGAYRISRCIGLTYDFDTVPSRKENEKSLGITEALPKYEAVRKAAQDLLLAVAAEDKAATSGALIQLGVFSFCPMPEQVFPRMENVALRVSGRAQQVFWVDLSLFAAEVGDYQRAHKYIQLARVFDPSSRELYNICVIEGLIALNAGGVDEAIQSMDSSTKACQADVDSSIQCSLLAPNLDLAEKLLELGERGAVLRYLTECHNVWEHCRLQIEKWIHLIEAGEKPDFQALEMPGNADQPAYRLN